MQSETEQIVKRLQEKKSQRESKLKDKISELAQINEDLVSQITKLEQQASQLDSESVKELRHEFS